MPVAITMGHAMSCNVLHVTIACNSPPVVYRSGSSIKGDPPIEQHILAVELQGKCATNMAW